MVLPKILTTVDGRDIDITSYRCNMLDVIKIARSHVLMFGQSNYDRLDGYYTLTNIMIPEQVCTAISSDVIALYNNIKDYNTLILYRYNMPHAFISGTDIATAKLLSEVTGNPTIIIVYNRYEDYYADIFFEGSEDVKRFNNVVQLM